jgi:hypothetical protein
MRIVPTPQLTRPKRSDSLLCALLAIIISLWVRSYICCDRIEFVRRNQVYALSSCRGWLRVDNLEQITMETAINESRQRLADAIRHKLTWDIPQEENGVFGVSHTISPALSDSEQRRVNVIEARKAALIARLGAIKPLSPVPPRVWRAPYILIFGAALLLSFPRVCRLAILRRRRRAGRCLWCGYDLRGSTFRCPECGAPLSYEPEKGNPKKDPKKGTRKRGHKPLIPGVEELGSKWTKHRNGL